MNRPRVFDAKEWLQANGYMVTIWFNDSWKVRLKMGDAIVFKDDAQLIDFAKSQGWSA